MKPKIRILIADDHEIFRDGFRLLFRNEPDIIVCGEAKDGKELTEKVRTLQPDIVVTDIQMPVLSGIQATKYIKMNFPETRVIALAMFNEISDVADMLNAGAQGYLLKNTEKRKLLKPSEPCMKTAIIFARIPGKRFPGSSASVYSKRKCPSGPCLFPTRKYR